MATKDILSLVISLIALTLSLVATYRGEKKAKLERQRTIRGQLTDVLGKLTSLQLEFAKLQKDAAGNPEYVSAVSTVMGQQNGFLLDQAVYLSEQIPELVTTYELNTIAAANSNAGNFLVAERYYQKAISMASNNLYRALATRSYGMFLFPQGRLKEAREHFRAAIELLKGDDNLVHSSNGYSYQLWALHEFNFARSPERAHEYFEKAMQEFSSIDVEFMRSKALEGLANARKSVEVSVGGIKYQVAPMPQS